MGSIREEKRMTTRPNQVLETIETFLETHPEIEEDQDLDIEFESRSPPTDDQGFLVVSFNGKSYLVSVKEV